MSIYCSDSKQYRKLPLVIDTVIKPISQRVLDNVNGDLAGFF